MKNLVPWLKANWLSVAAVVLAIIIAPVAMFFAARWRASIHKSAEDFVRQDISQLNAIDVTYAVQPYLSGQEPISVKTVPNEATTAAVTRILEQVNSENVAVREAALEFNARGKEPLINGPGASETLFPEPVDESSRLRLLSRMTVEWPRAHAELLRRSQMGMPLSAEEVVARIEQKRNAELSRLDAGQPGRTLTPDEQAEIQKILSELRMQIYRNEARRVTAYADPSIFTGLTPWSGTSVLPLEAAWNWQFLYWIHQDIIRAIANANADTVGGWLPVYEAPVKRIFSISVSEPVAPASAGQPSSPPGYPGAPGTPGGAPEPQPQGDEKAELARNFTLTHSGRASWPVYPNPVYDIRYVDLSVIASSQRLPAVLAAFPRTNFMTVVGLRVADYDPTRDLREGFDYGAEHLVRADIRVETVWLRGWMKKWMPPQVRRQLGIPDPEPAPAEQPADAEPSE